MSKALNKCTFIGNLGKDPEIRYTQNGTAVANFSIACTEKWKDNEHTEWVRLVAWQKLAEIVQQYLHKGDKIYVEASARTRKFQDQSGADRYITEYRVNDLIMLGSPGGQQQSSQQRQDQRPAETAQQTEFDDGPGDAFDSIPF